MIVEHSFITTLEAADALGAAGDLLRSRGWLVTLDSPSAVEAIRGEKNAAKAKAIHMLPQNIRLEYDRGRVTPGASLTPRAKGSDEHSQYLITIVRALEAHVALGDPHCCEQWDELLAHYDEVGARRRRRDRIIILCLVSLPIVLIVFCVVMAAIFH